MKQVTDIFFDLDHTLWDFDKNSKITNGIIFEKNQIDIPLEHFLEAYLPINKEMWQLYRKGKVTKEELRFKRLRTTFESIGERSIKKEIIDQIANDYITYLSQQKYLISGAMDILMYLQERYKLHIITNGFQEVQNHKLNNSEIGNYFDVIVNSDMAGVKKPDPKIFELALNKANVNPEQSVMIGDDLEADVMGAISLGMEAILYNYHNDKVEDKTIKVIKDLKEIKKYL